MNDQNLAKSFSKELFVRNCNKLDKSQLVSVAETLYQLIEITRETYAKMLALLHKNPKFDPEILAEFSKLTNCAIVFTPNGAITVIDFYHQERVLTADELKKAIKYGGLNFE